MAISVGMVGHLATLQVEGAAVAESTDFALHLGQTVVDLTNRDASYWRQLTSSTRDWSMTGTGNYYAASVGKKVLLDHWEQRAAGTITTLYIDVIFTFADGAVTATGKAFLTSLDFPSPDAGAAVFTFTLEGHDALVFSAS